MHIDVHAQCWPIEVTNQVVGPDSSERFGPSQAIRFALFVPWCGVSG